MKRKLAVPLLISQQWLKHYNYLKIYITNDQMWLWISTCRPINDTLKGQFNNLLSNRVSCWCPCWVLGNGLRPAFLSLSKPSYNSAVLTVRVLSPAFVVVSWSRSGVFRASDQTGHLKRKECSCLWSRVTWNATIGADTQSPIHLLGNGAHREDKEREKGLCQHHKGSSEWTASHFGDQISVFSFLVCRWIHSGMCHFGHL